jgi:hypothetical protein
VVLGLFYYWFGVADRYRVFLYGHTTTGIPPAQPFDAITASRYWMAGLVAAGSVLMLGMAAAWVQHRLTQGRGVTWVPAPWWQVWAICAAVLSIGLPAITMTVNAPTLPPPIAAQCAAATLAGLAAALWLSHGAAVRPDALPWLAADGLGLLPPLLLLRAVELPGRGLSVSPAVAWGAAVGGCLAGLVWLAGMSGLHHWRGRETPGAGALLITGLALSYLVLPLVHHLVATPPGFRYISTAGNFFAFSPAVQALAVGVAATMAWGVVAIRRRTAPT